jgi:hypothetical protein
MSKTAVPLLVVLALACLLVACSPDCAWSGQGEAWLDENNNGDWDDGEPPLEAASIMVKDLRSGVGGREGGATDTCGRVDLWMWMPGCPKVDLKVFAEPPPGYRLSTESPVSVQADYPGIQLVRFGFVRTSERQKP